MKKEKGKHTKNLEIYAHKLSKMSDREFQEEKTYMTLKYMFLGREDLKRISNTGEKQ